MTRVKAWLAALLAARVAQLRPKQVATRGAAALAALLAGAYVSCRLLFPSEDATTGTGFPFLVLPALAAFLLWITGLLSPWGVSRPALAAAAFVVSLAASAYFADYRFPAEMIGWEWAGIALVWLVFRAVRPWVSPAAVAGLLFCLTLAIAVVTWHQARVELPATLERLKRGDRELVEMLRELRIEPGTPEAFAYQARLETLLPSGPFAYSSTLGGFLSLGVPLLAVWLAAAWRTGGGQRFAVVVWLAALGLLLGAIFWTRCRSAMIAALAALVVMGVLRAHASGRALIRWTAGALGLAAIALALYVAARGWTPTLDNARQSVGYRLEYWHSSAPVFRERPIVGVGFGNFRSHYLAYKLPHSSEEIQDPHNFLVELAACGGVLALASYLAWLWLACREVAAGLGRLAESPFRSGWLALSVLVAIGLLGLTNATASRLPEGVILAVLGLIAWWVLARHAATPAEGDIAAAALGAAVGLHLHLLSAGGIGFPGLMLPVWALLGAASGGPRAPSPTRFRFADGVVWLIILVPFGQRVAALAARDQKLHEVRITEREFAKAGDRQAEAVSSLIAVHQKIAKLVVDDQASWLPLLGAYRAGVLLNVDGPANFAAALETVDRVQRMEPRRYGAYRERGLTIWEGVAMGVGAARFSDVPDSWEQAVRRYPNSASLNWEWGFTRALAGVIRREGHSLAAEAMATFSGAGRPAEPAFGAVEYARQWRQQLSPADRETTIEILRRALALDAMTPHLDKKLTPFQRVWAQAMVGDNTRG